MPAGAGSGISIAGGHERIAFVAGWEGASTQRDREAGFAWSADVGVPLARGVGNFEFDQARRATRQMFSGDRDHGPMRCLWRMIIWLLR